MSANKEIVRQSVEITIPFFDIDTLHIVWHGHYMKYFEIARCALLDKINYDYPEMKASGYGWPVVDLRVKYIKPLLFKQVIQVEAAIIEYEHRLKIAYTITDKKTNTLLTKGHSIQVAVELENSNELCFQSPKILLEKLAPYIGDVS